MNDCNELTLENFRCFRDEQRGRLRPITLLVGENSTGKSSFLASYMAMYQCFRGRFLNDEPDFNMNPFELGSFGDIVYKSEASSSGASEFKIGLCIGNGIGNQKYEIKATFGQKSASPHMQKIIHHFSSTDYVEFERLNKKTRIRIPGQSAILEWPLATIHRDTSYAAEEIPYTPYDDPDSITKLFASQLVHESNSELWTKTIQILNHIAKVRHRRAKGNDQKKLGPESFTVDRLIPNLSAVVPLAPIRSNPKRTYDPIREAANPEGDHIPMVLRSLGRMKETHRQDFRERMNDFGRSSGLFSDFHVKSFGDSVSDPFQILFEIQSGKLTNIIDVGYGVSQCLPIVTSILARSVGEEVKHTVFLLQQPEVHLHPRAQAEFANLICKNFGEFGNRFIVETHSDFIVDRVRLMVRRGIVKESDVSIIYFEWDKAGTSVKLFNIEVDSAGNIDCAPNSYREFFVAETDRILGFAD